MISFYLLGFFKIKKRKLPNFINKNLKIVQNCGKYLMTFDCYTRYSWDVYGLYCMYVLNSVKIFFDFFPNEDAGTHGDINHLNHL